MDHVAHKEDFSPRLHEVNWIVLRDGIQPARQGFRSLRSRGLVHDLTRPLTSHVGWLHLVRPFPNLAQADGTMEPVEDRQRHRDVRDDRPRPQAVEMELHRVRFRSRFFQRVNRPHRQIRHQ